MHLLFIYSLSNVCLITDYLLFVIHVFSVFTIYSCSFTDYLLFLCILLFI